MKWFRYRLRLSGLTGVAILLAGAARADAQPPVQHAPASDKPTAVVLWPGGAPGPAVRDDQPTLFPYLSAADHASGPAIVICPGGGYGGLAMDHEGHAVARWFQSQGVAAFVLKYRLPRSVVPGAAHGEPLADAQRAIRLVRSRAEEWHVDPSRVGIIGFSAGGHLASTAGTHFDLGKTNDSDPVGRFSCRPDFMVLVYPVISSDPKITHGGSMANLLGPKPDPKLLEYYSNERHVTHDTPPTLLVHASDDRAVPVENSLRFYEALRRAKVPAELHVFERGGHGFGMRAAAGPASQWPFLVRDWMELHGWLNKSGGRSR